MGFLDMINNANDRDLDSEQAAMIEDEERKAGIVAARNDCIRDKMLAFASECGMELAHLSSISPHTFMIGDFVFQVRISSMVDPAEYEHTSPPKVLWQYSVFLVGFDVTERIGEAKIGTLALLRFDGLRSTYNNSHLRLSFQAVDVIRLLEKG